MNCPKCQKPLPKSNPRVCPNCKKDLSNFYKMKEKQGEKIQIDHKKPLGRILLIAATVTALLAATALAAGLFGTKATPVEGGNGLSGSWGEHTATFPDTEMYLTFESENPRHEVYFKAGWLPTEPTVNEADENGYSWYLADEGEGAYMPYLINS